MEQKWELEQAELHTRLCKVNKNGLCMRTLQKVAGVDISFVKDTNKAVAAIVVMDYPSLVSVYEDYILVEIDEPYIVGFLAFREIPALLQLWTKLCADHPEHTPQVVMVDGCGIHHPREFGLASHFGVVANVPTIGVGKNLLCVDGLTRENVKTLCDEHLQSSGDHIELIGESGKVWGSAVRGCSRAINPVYVSIGHMVDLQFAVELVQGTCRTRIPEPIRQADLRSREKIRILAGLHAPPQSV